MLDQIPSIGTRVRDKRWGVGAVTSAPNHHGIDPSVRVRFDDDTAEHVEESPIGWYCSVRELELEADDET